MLLLQSDTAIDRHPYALETNATDTTRAADGRRLSTASDTGATGLSSPSRDLCSGCG